MFVTNHRNSSPLSRDYYHEGVWNFLKQDDISDV